MTLWLSVRLLVELDVSVIEPLAPVVVTVLPVVIAPPTVEIVIDPPLVVTPDVPLPNCTSVASVISTSAPPVTRNVPTSVFSAAVPPPPMVLVADSTSRLVLPAAPTRAVLSTSVIVEFVAVILIVALLVDSTVCTRTPPAADVNVIVPSTVCSREFASCWIALALFSVNVPEPVVVTLPLMVSELDEPVDRLMEPPVEEITMLSACVNDVADAIVIFPDPEETPA